MRALRVARALLVGSAATVLDFSVLSVCIRVFGVAAWNARIPALIAGALVQFYGSRGYTFRAARGDIRRQAKLFTVVQLVAMGLNWALFRLLVLHVHQLAPELLSFVASFVVFCSLEYPVRAAIAFRRVEPAE